jgi:hypothetical protein
MELQNQGFKSRPSPRLLQAFSFQWFRKWDLRALATNIICSFGAQQLDSPTWAVLGALG